MISDNKTVNYVTMFFFLSLRIQKEKKNTLNYLTVKDRTRILFSFNSKLGQVII